MAHLGVHAALLVEGGDAGGVALGGEAGVEALEERLLAVAEAEGGERGGVDKGLGIGLHGDGWELLVVADKYKLALQRGQQADEVRLEYLRGFVDDGELKLLGRE